MEGSLKYTHKRSPGHELLEGADGSEIKCIMRRSYHHIVLHTLYHFIIDHMYTVMVPGKYGLKTYRIYMCTLRQS